MITEIFSSFPQTLIIEFPEELSDFRSVVCETDMPTVDEAAALQQIIDSIKCLSKSNNELTRTAFYMSEGEGLFENSDLDNGEQERVFKAVMRLGEQIKNKLLSLNAYSEDYFPYILRRMLNANTLIFTKQVT